MIKVISDGTQKHFYVKCFHCGSELEYAVGDLKTGNFMSFQLLTCPICSTDICISQPLTQAEYEAAASLRQIYPLIGGNCCSGGEKP